MDDQYNAEQMAAVRRLGKRSLGGWINVGPVEEGPSWQVSLEKKHQESKDTSENPAVFLRHSFPVFVWKLFFYDSKTLVKRVSVIQAILF